MEIAPADKDYRKRLIRLLVVLFCLGFLAILWAVPAALEYLNSLEPRDSLWLVEILLALMFVGMVPPGIYLWRLAWRILKEERFPPSGMKLVRDTTVLHGKSARFRGHLLQAFGSVLILLGLVGPLYLHFVLQHLTYQIRADGLP